MKKITYKMKKEIGQVFTPVEVARYILDNALFNLNYLSEKKSEELLHLKIADISVGEGVFLIEAYSRLFTILHDRTDVTDLLKKEGYSNLNKWIVERILYGIDIDSEALQNAKKKLLELSGLSDADFNIIEGNTLLNQTKEKDKKFIFEMKFDYLFGNPPYSKNINQEDKKKYLSIYRDSIGGHPNLCTLFIHKSIDMLAENGVLGYLVAAPYISAYYNRRLRKMIAEKTTLLEVLRFEDRKKVIEGILQELSIIIFKKKKPTKDYTLTVAMTEDSQSLLQNNLNKTKVSFSKFRHNSNYGNEFLIARSLIDYQIEDKIRLLGKPLSKYAEIHTGEVIQFRSVPQLSNSPKEGFYPLLKIENVKLFKTTKEYDTWFKPKKGIQYIHKGKVILIKRLTSKEQPRRLISALFEDKSFAIDNKLNLIIPYEEKNSLCILGLLNSKLIDYYFRLYSSNTQVSANELRLIPFIIDTSLNDLVKDILTNKKSLDELNMQIFKIYNLTPEEMNHVLKSYE